MKIDSKDLEIDNLVGTNWVGIVEDNADPLFLGRCKIRVFGKFDNRIDPNDSQSDYVIPTQNLPWSLPFNQNSGGDQSGGGSHSVPKINSIVRITFDNGNIYTPVYHGNIYQSDSLVNEISSSYQNSHSLIYDTESQPGPIKIFFTESTGLMLEYNNSKINIRPNNTVFIEHSNGKIIHVQEDKISLGKENESDEPAVLGEKNVDALNSLADQITSLAQAIQTFATAQTAVTSSVFTLSPLGAALSSLNSSMIPIISQIQNPIKSITIPDTRSSTVSLDGPSKK